MSYTCISQKEYQKPKLFQNLLTWSNYFFLINGEKLYKCIWLLLSSLGSVNCWCDSGFQNITHENSNAEIFMHYSNLNIRFFLIRFFKTQVKLSEHYTINQFLSHIKLLCLGICPGTTSPKVKTLLQAIHVFKSIYYYYYYQLISYKVN